MTVFRLAIFILLFSSVPAIASPMPDTRIEHAAAQHFVSGHRLTLEAHIADSAGVLNPRCYFRLNSNSPHWFTPMVRIASDQYRCEVPALAPAGDELQYQFVIANKHSQVIRSQSFSVEIRESAAAPSWQQSITNNGPLVVYREAGIIQNSVLIFDDANLTADIVNDEKKLFGLRAGVYEIDHIENTREFMQGYFGGFSLLASGDIVPVSGVALNLNPQKTINSIQGKVSLIEDNGWSGEFYVTSSGSKDSITASVSQSGTAVDIDTSRSGRAGRFIGDINSSGDMFVIDLHDGEIWTTYFGPATSIRIVLADFVFTPSPADPNPPLYIVELDSDFCDGLPSSFDDVSCIYWAYAEIESIKSAGITSGCTTTDYCPNNRVTRDQMAVFLERGINGAAYFPPPATGNLFLDIPRTQWAAAWIEQLFNDGITGGCGDMRYCPAASVDRAQMAIFLLKAKHGSGYFPPPPTGMFDDVPVGHWAAAWIEQLAKENITGGCDAENYCPNDAVKRDEMAVFLTRAFGL